MKAARRHRHRPDTVRRARREIPIPLFVAEYRHLPENCPASTERGPALLSRASASAAARHGVAIEAEALLDEEHLLLLVLRAATPEAVHRFLAFLSCPGDLRVRLARTAEQAVERGGCGPVSPHPGATR